MRDLPPTHPSDLSVSASPTQSPPLSWNVLTRHCPHAWGASAPDATRLCPHPLRSRGPGPCALSANPFLTCEAPQASGRASPALPGGLTHDPCRHAPSMPVRDTWPRAAAPRPSAGACSPGKLGTKRLTRVSSRLSASHRCSPLKTPQSQVLRGPRPAGLSSKERGHSRRSQNPLPPHRHPSPADTSDTC